MTIQEKSEKIENIDELNLKIQDLEKELKPFLENLGYTVGNIFANSKSEVLKIIWLTSWYTAKDVINHFLWKYNEYIKLLRELDKIKGIKINEIWYANSFQINDFRKLKSDFKILESNQRRLKDESDEKISLLKIKLKKTDEEIEEYEKEMKILQEQLNLYDGKINKLWILLKKSIDKIKKYSVLIEKGNIETSDLREKLKQLDYFDKLIKSENIENLKKKIELLEYENWEYLKSHNKLKNQQAKIIELQNKLENLQNKNINKLGEIINGIKLEEENIQLKQDNEVLLEKEQLNLELIRENEKLKRELEILKWENKKLTQINSIQQGSLDTIWKLVQIAENNWNKAILLEEINDSIKPVNNSLSFHPSHVTRTYEWNEKHHKKVTTQAAWLEKLVSNQSE